MDDGSETRNGVLTTSSSEARGGLPSIIVDSGAFQQWDDGESHAGKVAGKVSVVLQLAS